MITKKQIYFYNFSARNLPDFSKTDFDSMIVENGLIKEIGKYGNSIADDNILQCKKIDLKGAIIFPPFVDAHIHFLQTGISLLGCQLNEVNSLKKLFALVSEESKIHNYVFGWNLQESLLKEKRIPSLKELDKICPKKFVWLARADLHSAVINTVTKNWANKLLQNSEFNTQINDECNLISGEIYNFLSFKLLNEIPQNLKKKALKLAEELCFKQGVGTVHALEGNENTQDDVILTANFFKTSKLNAVIYHQSEDPTLATSNNWKQIGGCLLVDGSIGSKTAALNEDYVDTPGYRGNLYRQTEDIIKLLKMAADNKLQLAMHAIGDKAIDITASCYAWARDTYGNSYHPHRIEHFVLPSFKAIRNARLSNSFICVQPAFDYYWGGENGLYAQKLGKERALKCNPFKTLLNSGLILAGGSDSPVTPINPILGIHSLVNHKNPDEQIDLNTALSIFISEPHKLTKESGFKGFLKKGFPADFVCLSRDPFRVSKSKIKKICPTALYISGETVYKRNSLFQKLKGFINKLLNSN